MKMTDKMTDKMTAGQTDDMSRNTTPGRGEAKGTPEGAFTGESRGSTQFPPHSLFPLSEKKSLSQLTSQLTHPPQPSQPSPPHHAAPAPAPALASAPASASAPATATALASASATATTSAPALASALATAPAPAPAPAPVPCPRPRTSLPTTNIDWADLVWNPVTGCTPVSEGCLNCYAAAMSFRLSRIPATAEKYRDGFSPAMHLHELSRSFPGSGKRICGGETGHRARPLNPDWITSLRDQSHALSIPFFFKQWGEFSYDRLPGNLVTPPPANSLIIGDYLATRTGKKRSGNRLNGLIHHNLPIIK